MEQDIMNMVSFRKLEKNAFSEKIPFEISFPDFEHGWLGVNIMADDARLEFEAAVFGYSALADVITPVADLLPVVGDYDKYFQLLRKRSRIIFDLEPQLYVFDFKAAYIFGSGYTLQILVAEQYLYYDGIWIDREDFEDFSDSISGFHNFKKSVLLAIEIPLRFFAERFYFAMKSLSFKIGQDRFDTSSEYPLVDNQLKRIRKYLDEKY